MTAEAVRPRFPTGTGAVRLTCGRWTGVQWIDAQDVRAGEHLRTVTGDQVAVTSTTRHTEVMKVYNLTVEGIHTYYVLAGDTSVLVHNTGCPTSGAKGGWESRSDFSKTSTMSKKYDAHAGDFGITGNRNPAKLAEFEAAMRAHMTVPNTKIYRFNYRNQGQAVGFIDPNNKLSSASEASTTPGLASAVSPRSSAVR
ncbi:polymorphic toxin-type HINT domain-containing protein [Lentzea sp. NPDC003310]|uniref:polymorphic toxin-type HINT domain-containing protein n=1 Tax=Lentzea sp. NPDC003310 TaxID=3154447 RepID=UPI0033A306AB